MKRFPKHALATAILLSCIGCDQATKVIATNELRDVPSQSFLGDTVRLVYAENPGAFLGMGGRLPPRLQFWLLTVIVGSLLVVGLGYLGARAGRLTPGQVTSAALLLGGGLSNWFDRLGNEGRVVDFMNLGIGSLRTGIFNVADLAIVAGTIAFALMPKPKTPEPKAA